MPSLKRSQRSLWGTVLSLFQSNSRKKQRSRCRRPRYGSTNKEERVKEREQSRERHKQTGRRRGNRGRGERRDYDGEEETWKEQQQEENTKIEEQKQEENTKTEEQNAREHIQRIRQDLGVDEQHNKLASGLERALNVLSEDVYQSPAHFFLELIQNADDNVYQAESSTPSTSEPKVIPTLAVAYRNGRLRTDCNELGFSKKNVDAICNAGLSTKKYESRSTGEKGVGFKSVFLVADIVWIASKAYTFKFDRGQRLGMLIPIWESLPPPEEIRQGYTSMVFQLSSDVDVPALLHGIRAYASKALIFLKQLRCINLNIEDQDEIPCASVTRKDENLDKRGVYMTTLTYSDNSERRYIVTEYKIDQMPSDKKRPNQTESEIKLAFPIDADGQPILQAQDVYSFLPVRSYGFTVCELNPQQIRLWLTIQQFLLQANFVLPTSREEISDKSDKSGKPDWNGKIRVEIPNAFVTAIEYLIQGRLRYSWIKFLPNLQPQKDFFEHVRPRIWASIAEKPFLASESDQLTKPSSLRYIPHEFRHSDDIPFTLGRNTEGRYLSRRYSEDDWSILKDLGVRQISLEEFLEDLKLLIECDKGIENKSLEWHLGLAEALNGHKDLDKNMKLLQTLQIIPLREGWTSADKGLILLPPEKESTALPPGIKVFEIHQDIQDNKENIIRRALFQRAGAKPYSVSDIHDSIVSNQVNKKSAESGPLSHLIAQLDFLHRTGWSNQGNTDIWVATTDNKYCLASSVYIDSNLEDSAAAIFAKGGLTVPLLHRDYLTISTENKESWIFFLFWNLGIYRIPRLVANINMYTQELSPDFERVTEILPSPRWLQLLKDHRNIYETWLDKARFSQTAKVREKLKSKLVECHDTPVKSALKDTFLVPKSLLIDNSIPIPRLKVENDHEHGWSILSHLEVLLDTNVQFYIRCLQRLRESENITPSEDQMYAMYRALQNRYSENQKDVVRHTFRISKLVYVPIGESKRKSAWLSADECVWEGPDSLLQTPRLEKVYKDCKHLFHEVLGVQDADPGRILKEIEICRPTILQDILELFQDADRLLKKNGEKKVKGIGLGSEIFPVYNFLDEWELRESAGTQVALLAFDYVDLLRMPSIMDAFELQSRMLSTWAKKSLKHEGRQQLSLETAHFHHRIRFIRRLISDRTPRLGIILHCLKNIKLFQAGKLTSEWTVVSPLGQRIITSNTLTIQSFLKEEDDGLHVYVATNTIAKKRFPVDLSEQLSRFCGIIGPQERKLAWIIMNDADLQYIEETLAFHKFPHDKEWSLPEQSQHSKPYMPASRGTKVVKRISPTSGQEGDQVFDQNTDQASIQGIRQKAESTSSSSDSEQTEHHVSSAQEKNTKPESTGEQPAETTASINDTTVEKDSSQPPNDRRSSSNCSVQREPLISERRRSASSSSWTVEGTDESESANGHSLKSGLRAESPISEPSDPPPNSLPSRLLRFVRSGSTKEKTTYQGGLAEGTILSLYRQVVDVKKESHEPILVGGPEREQHYKSQSQSQSQSRSRSPQSAPYIVDPGLPDRSLRDFTRSLVKRTTRKELAQVVYLDGVVDEISLDKNIITHTGRVHVDNTTKVTTVFVTLPDPVQAEEAFSGEIFVAKFLSREFPDYYKPDVHWTSPSRSPVGYNRDDTKATFTLPDAAKFTEFLVQYGYEQAKDWNNRPVTYQLDRFDMARKISMKTTKNEVFVLIRVYNIYDQPDMAFYVNPWNLYAAGKLDLTAQGDHYLAALMDASSDTSSFNITDYEWRDGYKYQPLEPSKGIRLLKLFPGKKESPLEGILFPTSLDAGDEYIAVSYTWGPALKPYRIRTEEGDIPIPASLYSALRQVRRLDETVLVWADAISIHQTDKPEKVQQISLLPVIFQQAVQVFGWVGERADQSELAIKSLRTMNDPKKENAISAFGQEKWTAISKLFQRPWFMRSWIIQEVILARDLIVHCGSDHIRWEDLYEAVKNCQAHAEKSIKSLDIPTMRDMSTILSLGETRHGYRQLEKTYNLLDLFELFHHAKATFKRDRLFTLLNVAADAADSPKLKPDYKSSLEDIVCRYASEFVHRKKTATLLYRGRISSQPERFPSWIPDWTADPYPKTITSWHPEREFCAAGKMEENAHLAPKDDKDDRILLIDGCLVDEIEKLGKCTSEVDDALDYIADIFEFIDKHGSSYLTRESIEDLKWKLPIGNAKKAPWGDWLGQAFRASFQALAEYMELRKDDSQKQFTEKYSRAEIMKQRLSQLHEELWLFLFTAIDFSERFRPSVVCLTKRGYFGLVPGTARKGDSIVLLYGGVVPFCLRRSEQKNIYQLVGEAYIHGIMHGEALDFEGVRAQTFDLY
ncbi:hypothetical protein IFM58399_00403 [Aspergillus lentulus]|uniref:uncharacterized protein n=1 Tax=Aspergillus lentulus TaxID=293939 RepID=UPI001393C8D7|nr:uncharacterized protein IFM58399_00403 [Aspergillus lentulus]GFF23708.1 hypothetical protein IFM58399_00403 [Aspergillus lentulus]